MATKEFVSDVISEILADNSLPLVEVDFLYTLQNVLDAPSPEDICRSVAQGLINYLQAKQDQTSR